MIPFVDLKAQYRAVQEAIDERIARVLDHGQFILGPEVAELEGRLSGWTGARHCVTCGSGTDALLIALMALGVGPGDEVITSAFSFVASAEVIVLAGAAPVFVDIEADTGNIDAGLIEARIGPRTRAILPVSLYGQPADMGRINALAEKHGLAVIEDGAQSFGATFDGRRSGNLSTVGCTSFFPSKPLGCYGDGGALFTSDPAIAEAARQIRVHGQDRRYNHVRIGLGGRMDTLQCAVVLAKLEQFEEELAERARIAGTYDLAMDRLGIERILVRNGRTSVHAQYSILHDERDRVMAALAEVGVPTAVHYPAPINRQPAYRDLDPAADTPVADRMAGRVLSLPMSAYLAVEDQARVVDALEAAL